MAPTKLTLALQKKGRLANESIALLTQAGFDFEKTEQSLKVSVNNFELELLFLRSKDIVEIVSDGIADIGISGQNVVEEMGYTVKNLGLLGFGACELCMAFREGETDFSLEGKRIATSYPNLLQQYLERENINAQIVELSGSVELAPRLKIADCICDLVSSGATLRNNGLRKGTVVFESQAMLIGNGNLSSEKQMLLDKLLLRLRSVLTAKKYKYVVMNAEKSNVQQIQTCIPGLKKPTVSELADTDFVSIASVVEEDFFWSTIEQLKDAGASGILVLPIEKMIL